MTRNSGVVGLHLQSILIKGGDTKTAVLMARILPTGVEIMVVFLISLRILRIFSHRLISID